MTVLKPRGHAVEPDGGLRYWRFDGGLLTTAIVLGLSAETGRLE